MIIYTCLQYPTVIYSYLSRSLVNVYIGWEKGLTDFWTREARSKGAIELLLGVPWP